jgi:hypothetical protein
MDNNFNFIQNIFKDILDDILSRIDNENEPPELHTNSDSIADFLNKNQNILFFDILSKLYCTYVEQIPEKLFDASGRLKYRSGSNAFLKDRNFTPNLKIDTSDYTTDREKNLKLGELEVCSKSTYYRTIRKIRGSYHDINIELYSNRRLFGILSTTYSHTVYDSDFSASTNNLYHLYKLIYEFLNNDYINNKEKSLINDPFNLFLLERLLKTDKLYYIYNLDKVALKGYKYDANLIEE